MCQYFSKDLDSTVISLRTQTNNSRSMINKYIQSALLSLCYIYFRDIPILNNKRNNGIKETGR